MRELDITHHCARQVVARRGVPVAPRADLCAPEPAQLEANVTRCVGSAVEAHTIRQSRGAALHDEAVSLELCPEPPI